MSSTTDPLAPFIFDPIMGWWQAELPVPFWGGSLPVSIDAPAAGPSPRQLATLRAVLAYTGSLREPVEEALLAHYNDERGCCTPLLGDAPPLGSADEVWPAMSGFGLHVPAFRSGAGPVAFELHMESTWDEEHGLGLLIRDWEVVSVAGQTDCQGEDA